MTPERPGLRKARPVLLAQRTLRLWQSSDQAAVRILAGADVMSEGATRTESTGSVYYGTSSILLPLCSRGGQIPDNRVEEALVWCRNDPHLRLRILRLARREAAQRAGADLRRMDAEIAFTKSPLGLRVDVEVEAHVAHLTVRRRA